MNPNQNTNSFSHFKAGSRAVLFKSFVTTYVNTTPVANLKSVGFPFACFGKPPATNSGSDGPPQGAKQLGS